MKSDKLEDIDPEFAENLRDEFDLDTKYKPSLREKVVGLLRQTLSSKMTYYVTGFLDGVIVCAVVSYFYL